MSPSILVGKVASQRRSAVYCPEGLDDQENVTRPADLRARSANPSSRRSANDAAQDSSEPGRMPRRVAGRSARRKWAEVVAPAGGGAKLD